jgi:hypothetical protein
MKTKRSNWPLIAASVTFALKAGLWFQRGRLVMVSPVPSI